MNPIQATERSKDPGKALFGFGKVWHRRERPKPHAFAYRAFFVSVPAAMLFGPPQGNWLFGINRSGLISVSAKDHGLQQEASLCGWISQAFGEETFRLVCFPRILGYQFKPVSFWLSSTKCVAEVHNTFSERHAYLIDRLSPKDIQKIFHVSPFCEVKGSYDFTIQDDQNQLSAAIDYYDNGSDQALLKTSLVGEYVPVTNATSIRALLTYPMFSLMVMLRIHWQAVKLWLKKVPFHAKPVPPPSPHPLTLSNKIER